MMSWNARFVTVALLLAATALFLEVRARHPFVPRRISLASFPVQVRNWTGTDLPISKEDLMTLAPVEFLLRDYVDEQTQQSDVSFFAAYLADGRAFFHHLPQDCFTGSGWTIAESGRTTLRFPSEAAFEANRYLMRRGTDRQVVLFWYLAHGRRVASQTWTNLYLIFDALRLNRNDYALIRMNTPLHPGEKPEEADQRLLNFAGLVNPLLNNYIPVDSARSETIRHEPMRP